jgi:hypothetical protein
LRTRAIIQCAPAPGFGASATWTPHFGAIAVGLLAWAIVATACNFIVRAAIPGYRAGPECMIRGSCLCGGVRFEFSRAVGPFELCHCRRCRKANGSAFAAWLLVERADYRLLQGSELITTFALPVRESPPAYRTQFCSRCGSPVPGPAADPRWMEIHPGLLDEDPQLRPDRHIFVDSKSAWFAITDELPQLDRAALMRLRKDQAQE